MFNCYNKVPMMTPLYFDISLHYKKDWHDDLIYQSMNLSYVRVSLNKIIGNSESDSPMNTSYLALFMPVCCKYFPHHVIALIEWVETLLSRLSLLLWLILSQYVYFQEIHQNWYLSCNGTAKKPGSSFILYNFKYCVEIEIIALYIYKHLKIPDLAKYLRQAT